MSRLDPAVVESSYLTFVTFLMTSKHRMIELGAREGLTGMQTMMLVLLDEPRPMNSFTKVFNCDASNVTGLVDGLEQKKMASRSENASDRRIKMVQLDAKGKQTRAALLHELTKADGPILSKLTPDEFHTFIGLLEKINLPD